MPNSSDLIEAVQNDIYVVNGTVNVVVGEQGECDFSVVALVIVIVAACVFASWASTKGAVF